MIRMKRPAEGRSYFPVYGTLHPGLGTQIDGCERWRRESDADAFDLVEGDLVRAAVVEASGAGAFVVCHLLGDFEFAENEDWLMYKNPEAGSPELSKSFWGTFYWRRDRVERWGKRALLHGSSRMMSYHWVFQHRG